MIGFVILFSNDAKIIKTNYKRWKILTDQKINLSTLYELNLLLRKMDNKRTLTLEDHMTTPQKCLKVSMTNFEDLPDEIQIEIFSFFKIKDLLNCSQVSKRMKTICNDESLWQKVNLSKRTVPAESIEEILEKGCKIMNLESAVIEGHFRKTLCGTSYEMKYLNLAKCQADDEVLNQLIASCNSVQTLSLKNVHIQRKLGQNVLKYLNPQKLQCLDLTSFSGLDLDCIKHLLKSETLTEISFRDIKKLGYFKEWIEYVVNNLPMNLEKISLGGLESLENEHVIKLVKKHKNLKQLELHGSPVENEALESIIEHAHNLEKLDVSFTRIGLFDYTKFLAVQSMPKLKVKMMTVV